MKMPSSKNPTKSLSMTIDHLVSRYRSFNNGEYGYRADDFPWAKGFVMGFPLPDFQRLKVWSIEQSRAFIKSIFLDLDIGSYLVNARVVDLNSKDLKNIPFADALLDGQQRLNAIELFYTGKMSVEDFEGNLVFWDDISLPEQRRFRNKTFTKIESCSLEESELREMYNVRCFGGVRHTEEQRA